MLIQIADAVAGVLQAASDGNSLSQAFTAERGYLPIVDLADDALHLHVIGRTETSIGLTRGGLEQFDYEIDVTIQKRLTEISNNVIDPLTFFVEEVKDILRRKKLEKLPVATCIGIAIEDLPFKSALEEFRRFEATMTLVYRVNR